MRLPFFHVVGQARLREAPIRPVVYVLLDELDRHFSGGDARPAGVVEGVNGIADGRHVFAPLAAAPRPDAAAGAGRGLTDRRPDPLSSFYVVAEQPSPDVLGHGPQPLVGDHLA